MSNHEFPETADIETSSDNYASRFSGEVGEWFLKKQLEITKSLLPHAPCTILDVGGGHAQLANPLAKLGYEITVLGSDDICKKRLDANIKFVRGNLVDFPFQDKSFDIVLSFRFISHCSLWEKHLSELARVSKQKVIIEYPVWVSLNALTPLLFSFKKKIEKNTRTYRLFYHSEIGDNLKANSFREEKRIGQYVLPMALYRGLRKVGVSSVLELVLHAVGLGVIGSPVIAVWKRSDPFY